MKVKFNLDSGANIHSCLTRTFDLSTKEGQKSFGYTEKEWRSFSEKQKDESCLEWAMDHVEIYFEEKD